MARKTPMRMCVGCREMKPKKELLRVVRTTLGEVRIDSTGKLNGRGAYICPNSDCLNKAQKIRALERALEHKVDNEVFERLHAELKASE